MNNFERAAHDIRRVKRPAHPHTIETYTERTKVDMRSIILAVVLSLAAGAMLGAYSAL